MEICLGFIVPGILLILCYLEWKQKRKMKKATLEEVKLSYWFKNSNKNEMIKEKLYDNEMIFFGIFVGGIIIFGILSVLYCVEIYIIETYEFKIYAVETLENFLDSDIFWNILGIDIEILAIISFVMVLKKDYYLGIGIKEVLKTYKIPEFMMGVLYCSTIIFGLYGIYNVRIVRIDKICCVIIELFIHTFLVLFTL